MRRILANARVGTVAAVACALALLSTGRPSKAMAPRLEDCAANGFATQKGSHSVFVAWFPATWCPTCRRQRETLKKLAHEQLDGEPFICAFDYDASEVLRDRIGVPRQSTLVRYSNGTETGRSVGETKPERLRPFLEGR